MAPRAQSGAGAIAHKQATKYGVYWHHYEKVGLRLEETARVGYGFASRLSNKVTVVSIDLKMHENNYGGSCSVGGCESGRLNWWT